MAPMVSFVTFQRITKGVLLLLKQCERTLELPVSIYNVSPNIEPLRAPF